MKENTTSPFVIESPDPVGLFIESTDHYAIVNQMKKYFKQTSWIINDNKDLSERYLKLGRGWRAIQVRENRILLIKNERLAFVVDREVNLIVVNAHVWYEDQFPWEEYEIALAKIVEGFTPTTSVVEWVYDSHGSSVTLPLERRPLIKSAYPWISMPIHEYIDNFFASDAAVLVLIGPPGTGKTSLIKEIIGYRNASAYVTYDASLMQNDVFFAHFIESKQEVIVLEDADTFLASRNEGNTMMHRFLNMSDGLVTVKGKKIIFSTNLPNIQDVDPALVRPGRCYDVLHHRHLTREESLGVYREVGIKRELPDGKQFTLAELLQSQPHEKYKVSRKVGFL